MNKLEKKLLNRLGYNIGYLKIVGYNKGGHSQTECLNCKRKILASEDGICSHYEKRHADLLEALEQPVEKKSYKRPQELPRATPKPANKDREIRAVEWSHRINDSRQGRVSRRCNTCGEPAVANSNGCSVHDPK